MAKDARDWRFGDVALLLGTQPRRRSAMASRHCDEHADRDDGDRDGGDRGDWPGRWGWRCMEEADSWMQFLWYWLVGSRGEATGFWKCGRGEWQYS